MKKIFIYIIAIIFYNIATPMVVKAQDTTVTETQISVFKDARLDVLAKKEAELNAAAALAAQKSAKGFRLMLLSTNDRNLAMKIRQQLLHHSPDQKVYMSFQPPNIKLKFGNFLDKQEAENMKKEITKLNIVTSNIYTVAEMIEVKPDKNKPLDPNVKQQ